MKKILIVITTAFVPYGGLTTVMMNYYRAMDKQGLKIDFASTNHPCDELINELNANNSEYYWLGSRKKSTISYLYRLRKLLKKNHYDVIHVNGNSATMAFELYIAKKLKVPIRISHGHNTKTQYSILHRLLYKCFSASYTLGIACSSEVGKWLYKGADYVTLNNAIDIRKYSFNSDIRNRVRQKLNIGKKFVVGNVGKLNEQKNHKFLIEVFFEFKKHYENSCLLIVGGGPLENQLKKRCYELGIERDIIFTGMTENAADYFQAMDLFVFPSLWEGLPLAVIEAQVSGLKCIVSSNVTKDTKCTENITYKDLTDGIIEWAKEILVSYDNNMDRHNVLNSVRKHGFDITYEAMRLRTIYLS